jgi:hypothetical protein
VPEATTDESIGVADGRADGVPLGVGEGGAIVAVEDGLVGDGDGRGEPLWTSTSASAMTATAAIAATTPRIMWGVDSSRS